MTALGAARALAVIAEHAWLSLQSTEDLVESVKRGAEEMTETSMEALEKKCVLRCARCAALRALWGLRRMRAAALLRILFCECSRSLCRQSLEWVPAWHAQWSKACLHRQASKQSPPLYRAMRLMDHDEYQVSVYLQYLVHDPALQYLVHDPAVPVPAGCLRYPRCATGDTAAAPSWTLTAPVAAGGAPGAAGGARSSTRLSRKLFLSHVDVAELGSEEGWSTCAPSCCKSECPHLAGFCAAALAQALAKALLYEDPAKNPHPGE